MINWKILDYINFDNKPTGKQNDILEYWWPVLFCQNYHLQSPKEQILEKEGDFFLMWPASLFFTSKINLGKQHVTFRAESKFKVWKICWDDVNLSHQSWIGRDENATKWFFLDTPTMSNFWQIIWHMPSLFYIKRITFFEILTLFNFTNSSSIGIIFKSLILIQV